MKEPLRIYDISPRISARTAVFPGDVPFELAWTVAPNSGSTYSVSHISGTPHVGAHADAPLHFDSQGKSIEQVDLNPYLGPTQVLKLNVPPRTRLLPSHLGDRRIVASRVLISTGSFPDPKSWTDQFASLSPELIEYLHRERVLLVGIDTPSVDIADDKELRTHQALRKTGMRNLEGLVLTDVAEGLYMMSALPLAIEGGDASPVRAVLWQTA